MPVQQNTYSKGLNKDMHPLKISNDQYEDMRNFKVLTDSGSSFGAIINEKGNRLDFCIPATQAVYSLNLNYNTGVGFPIIGLNGQGYIFVDDVTLLTPQQIYDRLINHPAFADAIENGDYNFYISGERVVLVGLNNLTLLDTANLFIEDVPAILEPKIVGWTSMDDKIIIFTTGNTTPNPTISDGQIWEINYDESTNLVPNLTDGCLTPSIHLKYNNCLNLSTEHAITRSLTRYETVSIARVYWTDNLNPLRSFNLFNPNGFAILCDDLDLSSNVTFSKPVITDISLGGGIPTGSVVQIGYRLLGNGKVTNLSLLTNPLPIYVLNDEEDSFKEIKGSSQSETSNNKSVSFTINNIDTDYKFIEYIYVINEYENLPLVYSSIEIIPSTGIINKTFTNTENDLATLSVIEINTLVPEINVVKDIAIKDNRLIAANHKLREFEITDEEFDARAYRFKSDGTATVYQSDGTATIIPSNLILDEEHDAINTYNNLEDINFDNFIYKSDGTTLGGEGINISYNFFTKDLLGDQQGATTNTPLCGPSSRVTYEDNFETSVTHFVNNQFNNYVSPFVHQLFGGYQRDEVYRFAIVFRSKKGELSFTKWIGDIKFPPLNNNSFKLSSGQLTAGNPLNLKVLGINFDITIPDSIKDKIDGYEIVRLERSNNDRSRIGGGALQSILRDGSEVKVNERILTFLDPPSVTDDNNNYFVGYISPETLFNTSLKYKTGDYLKIDIFYNNRIDTEINSSPYMRYIKMHSAFNFPNSYNVPILGWQKVASDNAFSLSNLNNQTSFSSFRNKARGLANADLSDYSCGQTTIMEIEFPINVPGFISSGNLVYATYCRNINNQYGGNTFESRSSNQYMSTGSFNPTNKTSSINVYGGDTYVNYFMYEQVNEVDLGTYEDKASVGVGFPCESTFNVELRQGNHFSKDRGAPDGTGSANEPFQNYGVEQFAINPVYTQENNISSLYQSKNFLSNTVTELPYSVWSSQPKTNGEFIDSFNAFLVNDQIDVDGNYGPINSIHNFKDKIFFYQNQGFGIIAINERVTAPDENGTELIIGNGQVLGNYAYLSTHTGCYHRTGVVASENNLYHYDARQKRLWRYTLQSKLPLSDVKGLSGFLDSTYNETPLSTTDNPTSDDIVHNVHGAYEHRYNRVFFTLSTSENTIQQVGDKPLFKRNTFAYNELMDSFESFYDFEPKLYLSTGRKLLSVNPSTSNTVYQHDKGEYGVFYDSQPYSSKITYLINGKSNISKEWNNLEWITDVTNQNQEDVYNETFDFIRVSNDYQDTNLTTLTIPDVARRRFRVWRHSILRDTNIDLSSARIRNPWVRIELRYNNTNNNRLVMNDLMTHYKHQPLNNY